MIERNKQIKRGCRLEYFTIAYNSLEGLVSIIAGLIAGSVSLVAFGIDSVIEIISGAALIWRLQHDLNPEKREAAEQITLRIVGSCFIALAIYILYDSGVILFRHEAPERSVPGIVMASLSVIVMPLLARAKRRVASGINSAAMKADSRQTDFCTYLSVILLGGLLLNALFGWWWADPIAALIMVPIIANEGIRAVRGRACSDGCHCNSSEFL
jgi:divalent metal cation (Fe/Co/Zn/Cd) transporter